MCVYIYKKNISKFIKRKNRIVKNILFRKKIINKFSKLKRNKILLSGVNKIYDWYKSLRESEF